MTATDRPLRVLVAGAGRWGAVHAGALAERDDVTLVGVLDRDEARAAALRDRIGGRCWRHVADVDVALDAAVVAVSTEGHAEVAGALLEAGVATLVEKPLGATAADLRRLRAAAGDRPRLLHAAMIERHNPAVRALGELSPRPLFVQTERLAPYSARSLDVDVVLDLMIHDLDLVLGLVRDEVCEVRAIGGPVLSDKPDMAHVRLEFAGGAVAVLASSRVSLKPVRTLRAFGPAGYQSIDLMERRAHRASRRPGEQPPIRFEGVEVPAGDALRRQHDAFVARARHAEADPGLDRAVEALELALRISADVADRASRWA